MGIDSSTTKSLLENEAATYSFGEEWFKDWGIADNRSILVAIPVFFGIVSIIPPALTTPFGVMCSKDGPNIGLLTGNFCAGISILACGFFFARAAYQRCTLKHYTFGILTTKESKINLLKHERFESDLGLRLNGTIIAINTIYLITSNLFCKYLV